MVDGRLVKGMLTRLNKRLLKVTYFEYAHKLSGIRITWRAFKIKKEIPQLLLL